MLRTLGIPTWFMTLSAADLHWIEMLETVSIHNQKPLTSKEIRKIPIKEWAEKLKANPVTAASLFQYRVESFFGTYILSTHNPIGKVKEYAIKIEFQERGSPHAHCLLWVDDAPKINVDCDDDVCKFIDKYVSGMIPEATSDKKFIRKLVKDFQTHSHPNYCRRNHACRFGFPKAPASKTIICREPDDDENRDIILQSSSAILTTVYDIIDNDVNEMTLDEVLSKANISQETYMNALKITRRCRNVILKRNPADLYTNGCNHEILHLWGANIDFQFVLDEYSTVMYVCSYMMKSEKAMGEVL